MNSNRLEFVLAQAGLKLPKLIIKRDGSTQEFEINRIEKAVTACFRSLEGRPPVDQKEYDTVEARAGVITQACAYAISSKASEVPSVEQIQNIVEITLLTQGEVEAAQAYMIYRDRRSKERDPVIAQIMQTVDHYSFQYPEAASFAKRQRSIFWTPEEIDVNKDLQDLRVNLTEAELHGVITVLKLFTKYEVMVGGEYWLGTIMKKFKRPEIQMMASTFGAMELSVHAVFYDQVAKTLMLDTPEFYNSYTKDPVLVERMKFVEQYLDHEDTLTSLAAFVFLEGSVLFSSFAFLKHFQSQGKNLLKAVNSGISFSVRDESLHCEAGAWLFKTLKRETSTADEILQDTISDIAHQVYEHESRIVDMVFEKGDISGIDSDSMKSFVKHRIKVCCELMGFKTPNNLIPTDDSVSSWFEMGQAGYQLQDFFVSSSSEYVRTFDESSFDW